VKDGKVVLKEKTYASIDARGHINKYTARQVGIFGGHIVDTEYTGYVLEITEGKSVTRSYITYDGEVLKIDYPDKSSAMVEVVPNPMELAEKRKKNAPARLSNVNIRGG
jgi:hypothetical protein